MQLRIATDPAAAASMAADAIARRLRFAVLRRGEASVAFSGGSTPAMMLADLAGMSVPWQYVRVFQVDERVAPDGDPRRNRNLLDVLPVGAHQLFPMPVTVRDLAAGARRYAAKLPDRFDAVHLGLGDDGHTASWPPGDPVVRSERAVDLCGEYAGTVRMTLTPRTVNAARFRLVLAVGALKRPMVERWLAGDTSLPVQRVRRTDTVVVLDTAAAPATATLSAPAPHRH
jgi:6-phosphogluconolactonase/glucosamine-6-phosphate isomerase/deaminase